MKTSTIYMLIAACLPGILITGCKKGGADPIINEENNKLPVCRITAPAANATFATADSVVVTVDASDEDGSISKVVLFVNNTATGTPKTTAPYTFTLAAGTLTAGNYTLKAVATDNKAATAEASVTISVNYIPSVYVAGSESNGSGEKARYWKNGTPVSLTSTNDRSAAYSIFVSGNDVYVAGYENNINTQIAKYWKNGTAVSLGVEASEAKSIYVNGNDVHVSGWEIINGFDNARYWKNGTAYQLDAANSVGNGVSVQGGDVYVAGSRRSSQGRFEPMLWKNAQAGTVLSNNDKHCFVYGIYINGSDVYTAGTQNNPVTGLPMATYWKNGTPVTLTDGTTTDAIAAAVFVSGSDVYVAGYEVKHEGGITVAKYWKNGVEVKLSDGTKNAYAQSVCVRDNDVYVAGFEDNPGGASIAKYWKNGVAVNLTTGLQPARAYSIVVK